MVADTLEFRVTPTIDEASMMKQLKEVYNQSKDIFSFKTGGGNATPQGGLGATAGLMEALREQEEDLDYLKYISDTLFDMRDMMATGSQLAGGPGEEPTEEGGAGGVGGLGKMFKSFKGMINFS